MPRRRQRLIAWGLGLGLATATATGAWAGEGQLGGAVSLDSDYRLRGVSLSDRRPALALNLAYDHASGAYAGAALVGHEAPDRGARLLGHIEYLGYAAQSPGGYGWDIGVNNQDFTPYGRVRSRLRYSEVYAGVSKGDFSARIYYAPHYLRTWGSTAYLDLNGVLRPAGPWRLSAHAGALAPMGGGDGPVRTRYDVRLGVAREVEAGEVRAMFTTAWPTPNSLSSRARPAVVVGLSAFF